MQAEDSVPAVDEENSVTGENIVASSDHVPASAVSETSADHGIVIVSNLAAISV
jgi:hypothetical protein